MPQNSNIIGCMLIHSYYNYHKARDIQSELNVTHAGISGKNIILILGIKALTPSLHLLLQAQVDCYHKFGSFVRLKYASFYTVRPRALSAFGNAQVSILTVVVEEQFD